MRNIDNLHNKYIKKAYLNKYAILITTLVLIQHDEY